MMLFTISLMMEPGFGLASLQRPSCFCLADSGFCEQIWMAKQGGLSPHCWCSWALNHSQTW